LNEKISDKFDKKNLDNITSTQRALGGRLTLLQLELLRTRKDCIHRVEVPQCSVGETFEERLLNLEKSYQNDQNDQNNQNGEHFTQHQSGNNSMHWLCDASAFVGYQAMYEHYYSLLIVLLKMTKKMMKIMLMFTTQSNILALLVLIIILVINNKL
jgi:hypothetical protein